MCIRDRKSSYHIFVLLEVHPCFSAYAAVYLRQQRRGDLYKINAAKIGGCGKTGKISGYSASQGNQKAGTVNFILDQCAVQVLNCIKIFVWLSCLKDKNIHRFFHRLQYFFNLISIQGEYIGI